MTDNVNHPAHYADGWSNGAEIIDITEHLNFNRGNAVKYIARAGKKDAAKDVEDLQKARWYLDRELERLTNRSEAAPAYQVVPQRFWEDIDGFIHDLSSAQSFTPRVWGSLVDVPIVSRVTDNEGDVWSYSSGRWYWTDNRTGVSHDEGDEPLNTFDEDGPFTEVLS